MDLRLGQMRPDPLSNDPVVFVVRILDDEVSKLHARASLPHRSVRLG